MEIINNFIDWWRSGSFSRSDFLAIIALGLSLITGVVQIVFGRSQHRVNKGVLTDRMKADKKAKEANIEVKLTGNPSKYVLEFKNTGEHAARNLHIEVADGSAQKRMLQFALRELPQEMEPGAGHRSLAVVHLGMPFPAQFDLQWSDGRGNGQHKIVTVYLP